MRMTLTIRIQGEPKDLENNAKCNPRCDWYARRGGSTRRYCALFGKNLFWWWSASREAHRRCAQCLSIFR